MPVTVFRQLQCGMRFETYLNVNESISASRIRQRGVLYLLLVVMLFGIVPGLHAETKKSLKGNNTNQRKALVLGRGLPLTEANGGPTHAQGAKDNFLKLVGNTKNDPKKGWTCDLSWDLIRQLGLDPNITPEKLFDYLGKNHLGYRIVMMNMASGQSASFWGAAVDNGIMPFAPHYKNEHVRYNEGIGIKAAVSVGGGIKSNIHSYGPSLEVFDAIPLWMSHMDAEDAAESWANQVVAARFAKILDAHPEYNIWDGRQHLRQAASFYSQGWTEEQGFGRVNEDTPIGKLQPGSPVSFWSTKSRDRRQVLFSWRNFLESDFAATVIARKDGRVIYEGAGTNCTWVSDVDGEEEFQYWSKNRAGEKSRLEQFNTVKIDNLAHLPNQMCLILGATAEEDGINYVVQQNLQRALPTWVCDIVFRPGNKSFDAVRNFPVAAVVGVLPDYRAMVSYAIEKKYNMIVVPATRGENLYDYKSEWNRATEHGIAVVLPHHYAALPNRLSRARRDDPPRLFSAIVVGGGREKNEKSYGPGLELFGYASAYGMWPEDVSPNGGAVEIAIQLAKVMDANTNYNIWDARQHLRQSASSYGSRWAETEGYGRLPGKPEKISSLDVAPPLEIRAVKAPDGRTVSFGWENFLQTGFAKTVITRKDGAVIYQGTGTNFVWQSDVQGEETFRFYSEDKTGRRSRDESYTVAPVKGLVPFGGPLF